MRSRSPLSHTLENGRVFFVDQHALRFFFGRSVGRLGAVWPRACQNEHKSAPHND